MAVSRKRDRWRRQSNVITAFTEMKCAGIRGRADGMIEWLRSEVRNE